MKQSSDAIRSRDNKRKTTDTRKSTGSWSSSLDIIASVQTDHDDVPV